MLSADRIRTGIVLINKPTIDSIPSIADGRPEMTEPKLRHLWHYIDGGARPHTHKQRV